MFGARQAGPTLVQLEQAAKQHLAAHPEIHTKVPRQLVSDADYALLYPPPTCAICNLHEMMWAFTQAIVARQTIRTRNAQACAAQTREAMDRVSAELCQKQIRHCHTWIERFMQTEGGGCLQQFGSMAALLLLAPALTQTEDDEDNAEQEGWTQ